MSKYTESTDHKLASDSGVSAPRPKTPDGDVTPATPSQVDTAAPRRKTRRSKKAKSSAPPPNTPDGDVTQATPSQAETGDPRRKAPRSKKAKPPSADEPGLEGAPDEEPVKPFAFGDQPLSEAVFEQMQAACVVGPNQFDFAAFKSMISVMSLEKPSGPFELMHMIQLAGLHALVMEYMRHLRTADDADAIELYGRMFNQLARTFAGHFDVLNRWNGKRARKG